MLSALDPLNIICISGMLAACQALHAGVDTDLENPEQVSS